MLTVAIDIEQIEKFHRQNWLRGLRIIQDNSEPILHKALVISLFK